MQYHEILSLSTHYAFSIKKYFSVASNNEKAILVPSEHSDHLPQNK